MTLIVFNSDSPQSIAAFASTILERCDVKPSSKATYKTGVARFLLHCSHHGFHDDVLLLYKEHLRSLTNISASTKSLYLNCAKVAVREMYRMKLVASDISQSVKSFKMSPEHKRSPIIEIDRKRVFNYLAKSDDVRAILMFHLLAYQGLRRGEVCNVLIDDFNDANATLLIHGKGYDGKTLIHLHKKTVVAIKQYLSTTQLSSGFFFATRSRCGHISTVHLHNIVQSVHRACKIRATVHAWRKYFTSTLLEHGFDVITTSKFTRHKNVNTVSIYYDRVSMIARLQDFQSMFG